MERKHYNALMLENINYISVYALNNNIHRLLESIMHVVSKHLIRGSVQQKSLKLIRQLLSLIHISWCDASTLSVV